MTLKLDDLRFESDIPELPDIGPVVHVAAPDFESRGRAMKALVGRLDLGNPKDVHTEFGRALVSWRGEVEYFHASGAIWSINHQASRKHDSELRDWGDLEEEDGPDGVVRKTVGKKTRERIFDLGAEISDSAGFDREFVGDPYLDMLQVAQFGRKGKERQSGCGEATMVFPYQFEGLPIIGGGAKTLVDVSPFNGALLPVGAVNVWRQPTGSDTVKLGGAEAILAAGLLEDGDLNLAVEKGGRIIIEKLRFGLMALPATMRQDMLFPVVEVSGRVKLPKKEKAPHYNFGRICPAATQKTYAKAGLYADYLAGRH